MNIRKCILATLILFTVILLTSCRSDDALENEVFFGSDNKITKIIRRVEGFPSYPSNYDYYDYRQAALDLDQIVFSFANSEDVILPNFLPNQESTWNPIGFWDDSRVGIPSSVTGIFYKKLTFGLPTYVGDRRSSSDGPYEAITTLSTVLGSSYVGIDKSSQEFQGKTYDFVDMTKAFYNATTQLVLNTTSNTVQGKSVWYDLYPQITFTRLYDLYQNDQEMKDLVLLGAQRWLDALPYMKDNQGNVDFEFTGFDVRFNVPFYGGWIDPPIGGLAFLFYSAYRISGNESFLDGMKFVLDYAESYFKNPNYEAMSDFTPYVAAISNALYGTKYDVQRFIDFLFENDADFRSNWAVLSGDFNGYPVHGLVGDQQYAFSMNSFNLASTMAPLVKYDARFADAIGRYMINLVNNAKWFFPRNMPLHHQTMNRFLSFDPQGALIYEGFRQSYQSVSPLAMGDATTMFGSPSDLSLYSSSHIGYLGSIVSETNVKGILRVDLNQTDSFGIKDYPTHLYYNPFDSSKTIRVQVGSEPQDLYDKTTKRIVARNVRGFVNIDIPGLSSRVLVSLPANARYTSDGQSIFVNGIYLDRYQAAVNITSPGQSRYTLRQGDVIRFSQSVPKNDTIERMIITFNDIVVYDGAYVSEYPYQKSGLPDTDYMLRVIIQTKNGLHDVSSTRVICL